ncbi:BlaI/MecI/CopY family transcriptional regulator [Enhygromyxa salina]|uniref:Methicillin resistance regulatory protein MecI n=1 Tax=Enhygromyxa salina TaxID=215803 RepID=A0A2S9YMB7_9BACT|nr:BlaI/MecI/CopY family transcriptional regulator [Enhygromyxa salina]PRQ06233.1 Methicillin resistance regulatory protein MecI [Enhygromyxa salina]
MEQLSEVQLAFMRALWAQPGSSVTQVKDFLTMEGRDLAPTTVATQLGRLEKKGLVDHGVDGRVFLYSARVSEQEVQRSVLARVTDGLFGGDMTALVHQLLEHDEVSAADLAEVKRLIAAKEAQEAS